MENYDFGCVLDPILHHLAQNVAEIMYDIEECFAIERYKILNEHSSRLNDLLNFVSTCKATADRHQELMKPKQSSTEGLRDPRVYFGLLRHGICDIYEIDDDDEFLYYWDVCEYRYGREMKTFITYKASYVNTELTVYVNRIQVWFDCCDDIRSVASFFEMVPQLQVEDCINPRVQYGSRRDYKCVETDDLSEVDPESVELVKLAKETFPKYAFRYF